MGISTLISVAAFAAVAWGKDIYAAQACISSISSLVIFTPSTPGYANASAPFNLRIHTDPSFVVTPTSVPQVQAVVACAAQARLSVSTKSGGHSYAAYGLAGDVVVDMKNMRGLTLNADGTAVVQTGNRLGEVATAIFDQGQRALPHGSCPYVGTGGHTLYGGFGYFGRIGGLLLDTVVSAEVVLANGTLVTADNSSHTDLFWALRGGGPSFGLVTAWTYQTVPAPPTTVNYAVTFAPLPVPEVAAAYAAWEAFATTAPNELAMAAIFVPVKGQLDMVNMSFSGNYYGTEDEFRSVVAPLVAVLPQSANVTSSPLGWIEGLEALAGDNGTISTSQPDQHDTFFAKSIVTTGPDSNASITSWVTYLATEGSRSNTTWFAQVDLYGGGKSAISAVPPDATAFAHRDAFLVYQLYASAVGLVPPYPKDGIPFVDGMVSSLVPKPSGAYPNYMDPTLTHHQWQQLYFGNHVNRLQQIKKAVDPKHVFEFAEGF
ncbi:hypothetical protein JB92DRAFT_2743971 [Gautieria morchelliformis]|nr:hypothetical protein JB92DRAFT_2743971 [Gautieria morchelliformis]